MHTLVFVGTYSEPIKQGTGEVIEGRGKGIYVYRLDRETGTLSLLDIAVGERNPSYVCLDKQKRTLFATNELKEYEGQASGAVSALSLDAISGRLTLLNRRASGGTDPCHVCVNDANTHVFVSNYSGGSFCAYPINPDGSLGEASDFVQHQGSSVNPARQTGPHAHQLVFDKANKAALAVDLGLDRVILYQPDFQNGRLHRSEKDLIVATPGAGPRHGVFDSTGQTFYMIHELSSTVTAYRYDAEEQTMTAIQTLSTLPEDFQGESSGAAIKCSPDGRIIYASNRGHDSLAIYQPDPDTGLLSMVDIQQTGGKTPRDFDIDPSGKFLIAGNQASDSLVVFTIDQATGRLTECTRTMVPTPICVCVADME